ncbi:MAG: AarF/ABC1/UbiB kinase family protein [Planctomycetes bacterium]|nr:AarF/ABC1/UbiB kinase family protein [Planctomycetota bacterium]
MLPSELSPTPLIDPSERRPLPRGLPPRPSPLRTIYVLYHGARTLAVLLGLWLIRRLTRAECARRVRDFLQRMGTVWVKAGQILAQRSDLLSTEFCAELSQIRDMGAAFPFENARGIIEEDLGCPIERVFEQFHVAPFAATTISQTHLAFLRREKVWVAVKVQQPHAPWTSARDMVLIRALLHFLDLASFHTSMRWKALYQELQETMTRELDFSYEASAFRDLKKTLQRYDVYVPDHFPDYCTRRVLVTEFIRAALMSDFINLSRSDPQRLDAWLRENNIEPRKLGRRLFSAVYRQIFEDNHFHGDMHPRNIILLRNSRLAVIDCRTVSSLEVETMQKHRMYLRALSRREYSTAADIYFLLASKLPAVDISEVKTRILRLWRNWETHNYIRDLPYDQKSLAFMFGELDLIVFQYRFAAQWPMSRLVHTLKNLDASLRYLCPDMNYLQSLQKYFAKAEERAARAPIDLNKTLNLWAQSQLAAQELPNRISELMLFQQTVVRRQAIVLRGTSSKIGYTFAALYGYFWLGLTLAALFFFSAFLYQRDSASMKPYFGDQISAVIVSLPSLHLGVWAVLALALLYFQRIVARMQKQLVSEDAGVSTPQTTV